MMKENSGGDSMVHKLLHPETAAPLFQGWKETIIWSCLEGTMGAIYARDERAAAAVLGDFCFLAGQPDRVLLQEVLRQTQKRFLILVPQTDGWCLCIQQTLPGQVRPVIRYATKKEPEAFNRVHLAALAAALPDRYTLHTIDEPLYRQCQVADWSRDLVSQYPDWEAYRATGLGVAAIRNGQIVSGASSYSHWSGGIEIEIDTHPDHRRQGLARACGARLILLCLDRGLYPSWDAHNPASAALALNLGYHLDGEYPAYEFTAR